ncbi:MAG TPA: SLBB domain-containing protein [Acidisarcina sp.]
MAIGAVKDKSKAKIGLAEEGLRECAGLRLHFGTLARWIVVLICLFKVLPAGAQNYPSMYPGSTSGSQPGNTWPPGSQDTAGNDSSGQSTGNQNHQYGQAQSRAGDQNPNQDSNPDQEPDQTGAGSQQPPGTDAQRMNVDGTRRATSASNQRRLSERPAPQPTEFQRLIAASLGETLPIFGRSLFQRVPTTFAPLDQVPVPSDYVIGPGDELRIHVWGQVNFNSNAKVSTAGSVYLPQVGEVHVAGLAFADLDSHLRKSIDRIYRNFDLSVEMGQLRSIQIFVVGQARRPGTYTISSLSTLVNALFYSGGPSPEGSMREIQVKRGSTTVTTFDLYDLLVHGDKSKDVHLLPGDVIFIPPVGPQAALAGSVRTPAIYELKGDTSIAEALQLAGGRSSVAADSRISVERISSHHSREALEIALDATNTLVQDGDLVRVISLVPRFEKTVTLRGNLANPGHFGWHPGMRLSELIPDKDSLITRNYWIRRGKLGLPVPEFEVNSHIDTDSSTDRGSQGQLEAGRTNDRALSGEVETGRSSLANAQSQVATQNTLSATSINDVVLSAPEIDWSYAVIERLDPNTLRSSLLPFDLGKLVIEHDPAQDLVLEAGDTVTIFSQADIRVPLSQQTKFVRLDGEFARSGIYSVLPGETLRGLVQRAGGLAPNSYLYGSEFTRVSTRAVQQQRLDEYVQALEDQVQRTQLTFATTSATSQDAAAALAATTPQQNLVTRLRQLKASGRIVLESKPGSTEIDSLPDLALEDGDHFVIPPKPASITVVGSVYNQNSFLYSPSRRVGDYLRLAGGPTRDSDPRRAFIIRADGSVLSRMASLSLWGNTFEVARLYPGDTLVVPAKVYRASALRGFLDWSQLFSQFALGAAAINVIK